MKKVVRFILKLVGKLALVGLIAFVVTFAIYMTNAENKLIYYVVRPLLNKHYDAQVRDRRIYTANAMQPLPLGRGCFCMLNVISPAPAGHGPCGGCSRR